MIRRFLILACWIIIVLSVIQMAQSTARGAVIWVKETVTADTVGTKGNFSLPYGIQQAFSAVSSGDQIRIVVGANNYDSTTSSWSNRSDANKDISLVTNFFVGDYATVSCWTDETTQNDGIGACLLDFNTGLGSGFNSSNRGGYLFQNIGVTNTTSDGWNMLADKLTFYKCQADSSGLVGFKIDGGVNRLLYSLAHTNGGDGISFVGGQSMVYRSESYGNAGDGIQLGTDAIGIGLLVYGNTGTGLKLAGASSFAAQVTSYSNTDSGIDVSSNVADYTSLMDSLSTDNGNANLVTAGGTVVWLLENLFTWDAGSIEIFIGGTVINQINTTIPTVAAVTYQNAAGFNLLPTSGNVGLTIPWPRATTTASPMGGAIQSTGGGAAGATAFAH